MLVSKCICSVLKATLSKIVFHWSDVKKASCNLYVAWDFFLNWPKLNKTFSGKNIIWHFKTKAPSTWSSLELKYCLAFHWPVIIASFRYMFGRSICIITVDSKDLRDQWTGTYGLKLFIPRTGCFGQLRPILVSSPTCTQQGLAE